MWFGVVSQVFDLRSALCLHFGGFFWFGCLTAFMLTCLLGWRLIWYLLWDLWWFATVSAFELRVFGCFYILCVNAFCWIWCPVMFGCCVLM